MAALTSTTSRAMTKKQRRRELYKAGALIGAYIGACALIVYGLHNGGVRFLFAVAVMISGAFMGWMLYLLHVHQKMTFSHIIVLWLIVNGTCMLWGVLYLAVTGAEQIAETLGRYIVTELLGTSIAALVKHTVENVSKNNSWPDKPKSSGDGEVKKDL